MLQVNSETGRLRSALVHEPGFEIDRMVPAMMEELLFDDILYGERAREEYGRFRRVLQLLQVELYDAADLLRETLAIEEARRFVLDVLLKDLPTSARRGLDEMGAADLAEGLTTGVRDPAARGGVEAHELYDVTPLPNWCFQRDPQVIVGEGVLFCSMATAARHREALLARAIFRFHPRLAGSRVWCDPIESSGQTLFVGQEVPHLEGGDVMVLSEEVLAIGLSERTNRLGIQAVARAFAELPDGPRWLQMVEIPRRRAYMHLDTLITQIDRDACLIYSPVILPGGREEARVWEVDLRSSDLALVPRSDLLDSLRRRGIDLEPIPCGGDDSVTQQREQWTDGANALAVAPGVITLYGRNTATADELSRHGFRIIEAEDVLLGREELDLDSCGRVCVLVSSHEMSRARGGPHCLVHPLRRDA